MISVVHRAPLLSVCARLRILYGIEFSRIYGTYSTCIYIRLFRACGCVHLCTIFVYTNYLCSGVQAIAWPYRTLMQSNEIDDDRVSHVYLIYLDLRVWQDETDIESRKRKRKKKQYVRDEMID